MKCPACDAVNADNNKFCSECGYSFSGGQTGQLNPDTMLENRYIIVKTLGRGGMGAVYLALDTRLSNIPVAIKEMSTRAVGGDLQAAIGSFKKEASMLISLRHPALPRILDFFSSNEDRWYLVMDYIEGHTLKEMVDKRGPIPEAEVLDWGRQLCGILDYLHRQNPPIIFRDLKPANIMLTPQGQIKLIDFGIARHFRAGNNVDTRAYGSSGFAPPEQYGENQTDPRSDIYALGATLHYLLTGKDPGKNPFNFEVPSSLVRVSPRFEKAVMQSLEFKTDNRPKSMQELLGLLPLAGPGQPVDLANAAVSNQPGQTQQGVTTQLNEVQTAPLNTSPDHLATSPMGYSQPEPRTAPLQAGRPSTVNAGYSAAGVPQGVNPASPSSRKTMRYVAAVLILFVLAGGGLIAWNYSGGNGGSVSTSGTFDTAKQYMNYLQAGNYADAYQLVKSDSSLDQDLYEYSMQKLDKQEGSIKQFTIESRDSSSGNYSDSSGNLTISVKIERNQTERESLVLINTGTDANTDWRIDLSDKVKQSTLDLPNIPDLEITVLEDRLEPNASGSVSITYFDDVSVPVKISGSDVAAETIDFPGNGAEITLQPSEKLVKQLEDVVGGYNQAWIDANQDCNMEHYEPYIVSDCQRWKELQNTCNSVAGKTVRPLYVLQSVEYQNAQFLSNYSQPTAEINATEAWTSQTESGDSGYTHCWFYVIQLQDDGSWKIIDFHH